MSRLILMTLVIGCGGPSGNSPSNREREVSGEPECSTDAECLEILEENDRGFWENENAFCDEGGVCAECGSDSDCAPGSECSLGKCGKPASCSSFRDCPEEHSRSFRGCRVSLQRCASCFRSSDCGADATCRLPEGDCVPNQFVDEKCLSGECLYPCQYDDAGDRSDYLLWCEG